MIHIKSTDRKVPGVVRDLKAAAARHGFGVLHIHDLQATMRSKGVDFLRECRILEICNPAFASTVLEDDMRVGLALPCRITVFTEDGRTRVGTLLPSELMGVFGGDRDAAFLDTVRRVEEAILAMIDEVVDAG